MRIKLTRIMAGPDGAFSAGTVVDVDKAQASALIAGGYAEKIAAAPVVVPAPEEEPEAEADADQNEEGEEEAAPEEEPEAAPETATAPRAPERAVRPPAKRR